MCDLGYYEFVRYAFSRGFSLDDWKALSFAEIQGIIIASEKLEHEETNLRLSLAGVKTRDLPQWRAPSFTADDAEKARLEKIWAESAASMEAWNEAHGN